MISIIKIRTISRRSSEVSNDQYVSNLQLTTNAHELDVELPILHK